MGPVQLAAGAVVGCIQFWSFWLRWTVGPGQLAAGAVVGCIPGCIS